jgi:hypothetical protein
MISSNMKMMSVNKLRTPAGLGNFKLHSFRLAQFQTVKKNEIITLLKAIRFFLGGGGEMKEQ